MKILKCIRIGFLIGLIIFLLFYSSLAEAQPVSYGGYFYDAGYRDALANLNESDVSPATRNDVLAFLERDKTDELEGIDCLRYSTILIHYAMLEGLQCDLIVLRYNENIDAHAVVCFPTQTGLLYIEPMHDAVIDDIINYWGTAQTVTRWITRGGLYARTQ